MQFKTKLGLVDIPNSEVLAAAREIEGGATTAMAEAANTWQQNGRDEPRPLG